MSEFKNQYQSIAPLFVRSPYMNQSIVLTQELKDLIASLPVGGKFVVKAVRAKEGAPRTRPVAYLEYATKETLDAEKAEYLARRADQEETL